MITALIPFLNLCFLDRSLLPAMSGADKDDEQLLAEYSAEAAQDAVLPPRYLFGERLVVHDLFALALSPKLCRACSLIDTTC